MARLNLKYYKNETEYSDGAAVEDEILEIVRNKGDNVLKELGSVSWPIFYHLSHLRENILNWYPFKKDCTILEVGSGCGAITGLLCNRAKYVASIELTEKRATINYERHKDCDNLEIFVGNLSSIQIENKFDYIVVNGVLEYAGGFISGDRPYEEFINMLTDYLTEDGVILIAIENRLGLKYFSGAKEDHVGKLFAGLNGYQEDDHVRTFSQSEITKLIENCNLTIEQFYYPYPDYKFPEVIYTEKGFSKVPLSYDVHSYDTERYMFFDEIEMQNLLVKEGAGAPFSNSFLIDVRKKKQIVEKNDEDLLYVKINSNRDDAFKICTTIYEQEGKLKVKKQALSTESIGHLEQMIRYYQQYNHLGHNARLLPTEMVGEDLVSDFVVAPTMETVLLEKEKIGDKGGFLSILNEFYSLLHSFGEVEVNSYTKKFHDIFGPDKADGDLEFTAFNNIDVLFDNIFYEEHEIVIFDYEWFVDCPLPVKFIFWRSVKEYYARHRFSEPLITERDIYLLFNISDKEVATFYKWEGHFSANYVKMMDKSAYRKKMISLSNIDTIFDPSYCTANLYVDTGNGFNDQDKCQVIYDSKSERLTLEFNIRHFSNISGLRFDPVEGCLCFCKIEHAEIDGKQYEMRAYNAFPFSSDGDLFLTTDPVYLFLKNEYSGNTLTIHFSMQILKEDQIYEQVRTGIECELEYRELINEEHHRALSEITNRYSNLNKEFSNLESKFDHISLEKKALVLEKDALECERVILIRERGILETERDACKAEISRLEIDNRSLMLQRDELSNEYHSILNSTSWKLTKPLRWTLDILKSGKKHTLNQTREYYKLLKKTKHNIKSNGWKKTIKKIFVKGRASIANVKESGRIADMVQQSDIWQKIENWIDETPHSFIDIFHVPMGWNTPLFQRFQHLSLQAGNIGGISFYGAHPLVDKDIEVCEFVTPTLCVVNLDNYEVKRRLFEILDRKSGLKIIRLQSIDLATTIDELKAFQDKGYAILYEYIDELTPQITGNIPKFVFDRHEYVLKNENISIVATADKLFDQVKPYRERNMDMITNGVDYDHWDIDRNSIKCPADIQEVVNEEKIIIGYHGALAQWIDYSLLKRLADDKRFILLLIGYEHDDHLQESGLLEYENVKYIGSKPYSDLSQYAAFYDIAILPFIVNDITKSVSPVKIFEYMAQQKPIVTYALPECLKYKSCLISYTQDEFIDNINKAIELRYSEEYCAVLKQEALENTWKAITEKSIDLVKNNHVNQIRQGNELDSTNKTVEISSATTPPQEKRYYRTLKKIFWKIPIMPPKMKERFLFKVKKTINPSLLSYVPTEQETLGTDLTMEVPVDVATEYNVNQANYIDQILKIPDQGKSSHVPITESPYRRQEGDNKIIAYYLTQFHPDPHNEQWWGKGVTEWNNVCRAVPQFVDHYQPRLPGELGFYDLRLKENMMRQVELAKMYGVYGFSFYYYWFDGERLLEKPIEMFLADKSLDFPFSLCWANENWTKRFDGTNSDVLMEQPKSVESYKNVIHDMVRFLRDKRYITIKGKKLITVYRPALMPEPNTVLQYWREYCLEQGIGDLYIVAVKENMVELDLLGLGYDAISEFHPGTVYTNCKNITNDIDFIRKDFSGEVFDYKDLVENQKYFKYNLPKLYRAVMPMWDNTARRNNKGMIFQGATPALYKQWLKDVIMEGQNRSDLDDQMVFINAWNEWGEGAYLEPDKKYGYAYLEATKEAVEESRVKAKSLSVSGKA
ncbi:glycoside hydrolase family 99-like domain-containing protein [Paenibacillus sp. NAIST15-1]|uniref:glycoside hydrolase family 99-like domain-containing protein n=1 Tax=Paenibacillus sp. NAIST15-1 TaxID=1605994 RepID=UPI000869D792|nr:glycoside hydrolase family 99-like domain-containing protein [Paenibacillus sp. NAIST15-1]GAV12380.1 methyltransferase type 12 [Paenibacillus sp. NAIST15-1]